MQERVDPSGRHLGSRVRDQLILVRGGRLFTTQNFTHNTKHTYMLRLLAAVQRAGGPLPFALESTLHERPAAAASRRAGSQGP